MSADEKINRSISVGAQHGARAVRADFRVDLDYADFPPHPTLVRKVLMEATEDIMNRVEQAMAAADRDDEIFKGGEPG